MKADVYTDVIWQKRPNLSWGLRSKILIMSSSELAQAPTSALFSGEIWVLFFFFFTSAGIYKTFTDIFCLQDLLITNTLFNPHLSGGILCWPDMLFFITMLLQLYFFCMVVTCFTLGYKTWYILENPAN